MKKSTLGLFCERNGRKWGETDRRNAYSLRKVRNNLAGIVLMATGNIKNRDGFETNILED